MNARSDGQEVLQMLVITRREGEEVVMGDRVRLAFAFPREIDVHRREVADQILAAKPPVVGSIRPAATEAP
jgi:sRNA-binding carbon storage regulator CsrA